MHCHRKRIAGRRPQGRFWCIWLQKELIEKRGYNVHKIPQELRLVGNSGTFDLKGSIKSTLWAMDITGGYNLLTYLQIQDMMQLFQIAIIWCTCCTHKKYPGVYNR
jgi:hypothetical protein